MDIVRIGAERAGLTVGLCVLLAVMGSCPSKARAADLPVGNIVMPPVTPEQASQYLNARVVPSADAVPAPPVTRALQANSARASTSSDQPVVAPVLGHDLPVGDTTPSGFKRADFAQAAHGGISSSSPATGNASTRIQAQLGAGSADAGAPPAMPPLVIGAP